MIAEELIAMRAEDQRVRAELAADGSLFQGYHPRMREVHDRNAARLSEILDEIGWPSPAQVGEEASHAAWLVAQHAIGHPQLMRRVLSLLNEADGVDPVELAMLEDRIRGFEGRPQRYGTQFNWDADGLMSPLPHDDEALVDQRRARLGLPKLADAIARARESNKPDQRPRNHAEYMRGYEQWLREAGWRQ